MKKYFAIAFFFCIVHTSLAQINLVPNPSFEDTVSCPVITGAVYDCVNWSSFGNSPDYYLPCFTVGSSITGFQLARTGDAYIGFANTLYVLNRREYFGAELTETLIVGTTYYVSFFLNLAYNGLYTIDASNKQGVLFSTVPFDSVHAPPLNNFAQITNDNIIQDSINWTLIKGSFVADSNYKYIIIGNFYDDLNCDTVHLNNDTNYNHHNSYYLIDDICVSTDSSTCFSFVDINDLKDLSPFTLFPNPANGNVYLKNLNEQISIQAIDIYDGLGRKIKLEIDVRDESLDFENQPAGIYFLIANLNGNRFSKKIIVLH